MLLQYSYDNAMLVLDLLKENKIACLDVQQKDGITFMEYKLVAEFPHPVQAECLRILGNSLSERLYLINLWHDFIVSKSAGRDIYLRIRFNTLRTKELEFTHSLAGDLIHANTRNTKYEKTLHCLEVLQNTLTDMGVTNQQLVNVYRKEGTGRSKKHIPLTLGDLLGYIRKAIED